MRDPHRGLGSDRRALPRLPCDIAFAASATPFAGDAVLRALDISTGGMRFHCNQRLREGDRIDIEMAGRDGVLRLVGLEVLRVDNADAARPVYACRFTPPKILPAVDLRRHRASA